MNWEIVQMTDRTISLRSELVERLETLAHGRDLNDVMSELLEHTSLPVAGNWALAIADGMEQADIDWLDEPDASVHSREQFEKNTHEKWLRTQNSDNGNDA